MIEVILPVLDEIEALPGVLAGMPDGYLPLVVDNGSSDGSGDLARSLGARVVDQPIRGFGAACWTGLGASTTEVVCFMDADGSLDPTELAAVAEPVVEGRLDLCLGRRRLAPGSMPWHARLGNRVLAAELRRRTGLALRDLGPMRAARRAELIGLGLADRRSGWPLEMVLAGALAQWRIGEVTVGYQRRAGGRSKVTGTIMGTLRASREMARLLGDHPAADPKFPGRGQVTR